MTNIRHLVERDIPEAAELFARVYPKHRWRSQPACEAYFKEVLFDNPWRDPQLPSWVAEDQGRLVGLQAVIPRPMAFHGRPLRAAVTTQFLVDPDQRYSLTALQLVQACVSGPQDLTLADGGNDHARRICLAIGGVAPLLYGLHWIRPLRPARCALSLLEQRESFSQPLRFAAKSLAAAVDMVAAHLRPNRFLQETLHLKDEALDPSVMLTHWQSAMGTAVLHPLYDRSSLPWLLDQAAHKTRHGALRMRGVLNARRQPVGWYLYYLQPGDIGEVVQIAARPGAFDGVLQQLLKDAWRHGAVALRGRLDPPRIQELSRRHCWLRRDGTWTLVYSRDQAIVDAFQQGRVFLSRLDGEWWLRFLGERHSHREERAPPVREFHAGPAGVCTGEFARRNGR